MMRLSSSLPALLGCVLPFAIAYAQCRPGKTTNEAKLLAFYSAPLTFSILGPAEHSARGWLRVAGEGEPIPNPDPEVQKTGACFTSKSENTSLSPAFGRPRVVITLPYDFTFEASFLPPVTIADATANLLGVAMAKAFLIPGVSENMNLSVRVHAVRGNVKGPITCPRKSLQSSSQFSPCYGAQPSRDTFRPNVTGVEVAFSAWSPDKSNAVFLGVGENWLRPRFQVGFTSGTGAVDNTRVEVDLVRTAAFAGYNRRLASRLDATAEVYSVPADVTLFRASVSYLAF